MRIISLNKASDPLAPDDLRINTSCVLYVEASRPDLVGRCMIHMLGQGTNVNAVTEPVSVVVALISSLVGATRHYLAQPPDDGASTVYVAPFNVSYARPNLPAAPDFWVLTFVDGSELRVTAPLPDGL